MMLVRTAINYKEKGSSSILHKNYQKLVGAGDVGTTLITIPGTYAPNTNTLSFLS